MTHTIMFEARVPVWKMLHDGTRISTAMCTAQIFAHGKDADEIFADLSRQAAARDQVDIEWMAVSIHNNIKDYEAIFPPPAPLRKALSWPRLEPFP